MVTFLITSVFVLALFAIAIYFWQKPANKAETTYLPPAYPPTTFLSDVSETLEITAPKKNLREDLLTRATSGDFDVLLEAKCLELYPEVLGALVSSQSELSTLASFLTDKDLRANRELVNAVVHSWTTNPNRQSTTQMLHIAALSDDAELYDRTVQRTLNFWRAGKLLEVSASDLMALFNGQFWLLSSRARTSGAGFILKRTLSSARRELEGINN